MRTQVRETTNLGSTMGKKRANGIQQGTVTDSDTDAGSKATSNGNEQPAKRQRLLERTDPLRWRLRDVAGCQTWHYLDDDAEVDKWPQSLADKYFLELPLVSSYYDR